ncbi:MAG: UDP-N-acetylmuramate dehydrogenase [Deinococcota bacterium]
MAAPKLSLHIQRRTLASLTTLGVGGDVEVWELTDPSTLLEDLQRATDAPYRILGAGSNILAADSGVPERVIKFGRGFNSMTDFEAALDRGETSMWLAAATPLPGLVRRAAMWGMSGLEGLLGVPAVLGGALAMNAGTRFGDMAAVVSDVELFVDGKLERLPASDITFNYRHTNLPEGAIITAAKLALTASSPDAVKIRLAEVDAARKGQPKIKSAGCAFKNPPGDSAGRLIDQAGLKGLTVGAAMVSYEHGNFIVNQGGASATDVLTLLARIQEVLPQLEPEWRLWGVDAHVHDVYDAKGTSCAA